MIDCTKAFDYDRSSLAIKEARSPWVASLNCQVGGRLPDWPLSSNQTRAIAFQMINYQPQHYPRIWLRPMLFIIYAADLKAIGVTNHLSKYADDTSLLVPEHCDVSLEQ